MPVAPFARKYRTGWLQIVNWHSPVKNRKGYQGVIAFFLFTFLKLFLVAAGLRKRLLHPLHIPGRFFPAYGKG
jgi:hypothetical protein